MIGYAIVLIGVAFLGFIFGFFAAAACRGGDDE